jgi:hypothetical protein
MVERLGDQWGLNTASLSRRGSLVLERLCDVLVLSKCFSWRAEEICKEIIGPQNPQSCPSQKKAAHRDVTTKTALKSGLRKMQQISK